MYASESPGNKYPREAIMRWGPVVDCTDSTFPVVGFEGEAADSGGSWQKGSSAVLLEDVYPEYLTDVNLYRCPSSATEDRTEQKNAHGDDITTKFCSAASATELGVFYGVGGIPDDGTLGGTTAGAILLMSQSYSYWGHLFDKVDDDDPMWDDALASQWVCAWFFNPCYEYWGSDGEAGWACWDNDINTTTLYGSTLAAVEGASNAPGPYGNGGSNTIYRLREGIERFLITNINNPAGSAVAQSEIPVYWDWVRGGETTQYFNHVPGGSNVLYLDGHVEFQRYPGRWPAVKWYTGA
jgi:prepilin-type processing-associated H-X9-DG protein